MLTHREDGHLQAKKCLRLPDARREAWNILPWSHQMRVSVLSQPAVCDFVQQPSETNTVGSWRTEKAIRELSGIIETVSVGSTAGPQSNEVILFNLVFLLL